MSDKINANAPGYDAATPEIYYEQRIAELEKQLAERDAALARCVDVLRFTHWMPLPEPPEAIREEQAQK